MKYFVLQGYACFEACNTYKILHDICHNDKPKFAKSYKEINVLT